MNIPEIISRAHETSAAHGFWDVDHGPATDMAKIALMHTELSEATEAVRDGNYHGEAGVTEELADTVIRIADYCGKRGLDLDYWIKRKMLKNEGRPHGHGRKVAL